MSNRQDQEREARLQPKRKEYAIEQINNLGIPVLFSTDTRIEFLWKGHKVLFFPYSGWHSGSTIKDGRGLNNLLKQLK